MSIDKPSPMDFVVAGFGGPGGIDSLSRRGHAQMQTSERLPARSFNRGDDKRDSDHAILARAGVVFGVIDEGYKIFQEAKLPAGWKIERTGHRLYSDLLDDQGHARAQIMYDAQDREAWISCNRRFRANSRQDDHNDRNSPYIPVIEDSNGEQVWRGTAPVVVEPSEDRESASAHIARADLAREIAWKKLLEVAPEAESYEAYWDKAPDFPPHETPVDTRERYVLMTDLYSHGSHVDGGEHASAKAKDDAEGVEKLMKLMKLMSSLAGRYEVRWTVLCGKRVVERGTVPCARREREYGDMIGPDGRRWRIGPDGRQSFGYEYES